MDETCRLYDPLRVLQEKFDSLHVVSNVYIPLYANQNVRNCPFQKQQIIERKNHQQTERQGRQPNAKCGAFHYIQHSPINTTSLYLVLDIGELGPTHVRSVLGGVRSGSKRQDLSALLDNLVLTVRWCFEQSPGRVSS